jgi:hypothetical protein
MTYLRLRPYYLLILVVSFLTGGYLAWPGARQLPEESAVHTHALRMVSKPPLPVPPVNKHSDSEYRVDGSYKQYPLFPECEGEGLYTARKICSDSTLMRYVHSHLEYPQVFIQSCFVGMSVLHVKIDVDGKITSTKVVREMHPAMYDEVRRIGKLIMKEIQWEPARDQNDEPTACSLNIPIRWNLQ